MISESLRSYYRDEIDNVDNDDSEVKSFKYNTNIIEKTPARPLRPAQVPLNPDGTQPPRPQQPSIPRLNTEVTIPLKYFSNFWKSTNFPLINFEIEPDLRWPRNGVFSEDHDNITGVSFMITSTKLYVPVVSLPINDQSNI